jgi:hypothetical protein
VAPKFNVHQPGHPANRRNVNPSPEYLQFRGTWKAANALIDLALPISEEAESAREFDPDHLSSWRIVRRAG